VGVDAIHKATSIWELPSDAQQICRSWRLHTQPVSYAKQPNDAFHRAVHTIKTDVNLRQLPNFGPHWLHNIQESILPAWHSDKHNHKRENETASPLGSRPPLPAALKSCNEPISKAFPATSLMRDSDSNI